VAEGKAPSRDASVRLVEIDALRGLAALSVVLFHYTTRFTELYQPVGAPSVTFPHGHYGVNLFFIISGFVIFMTLERTRRPMDFVVSRFSRLFPAYWGAVALTYAVTSTFGLPGKEVTLAQAWGNLVMVHGLLRIPHVDGVYWTLEVELLFYAGMFALLVGARLQRVHWALWVLLGLRLLYHVLEHAYGIEWSWTLSRLLILKYIPWFALGICIYQTTLGAARADVWQVRVTAAAALACLAVVDHLGLAALALVLATLVWAAASGRLRWLRHPLPAFFGTISYPLYLLHENIGWVAQRAVQARGGSFDLSIVVALALSVLLATALTFGIEQPAMRAIRGWYRQRLLRLA
jgi:peptidoglycan/LPS O-acetylase OafA/YrhL